MCLPRKPKNGLEKPIRKFLVGTPNKEKPKEKPPETIAPEDAKTTDLTGSLPGPFLKQ